jgi:hypothetical protein
MFAAVAHGCATAVLDKQLNPKTETSERKHFINVN